MRGAAMLVSTALAAAVSAGGTSCGAGTRDRDDRDESDDAADDERTRGKTKDGKGKGERAPAGPDGKDAADSERDAGALPPPAATALAAPGRALEGLAIEEEGVLGWHALEGRAAAPAWGEAGTDPNAARDDDLLTSWTCRPALGGGKPCALGLVFPEAAELRALRLFASAGTTRKEHAAHGRAKLVRVHTDAGWTEVTLRDGWDHRHVVLPPGVTTRSVTVEVRDAYPGKEDVVVHVAEIEAFGARGARRPPLALDPAAAIARTEGASWAPKKDGGGATAAVSWIELVDGEGGPRRLLRGTALFAGAVGSRVLIERRTKAACTGGSPATIGGSFALLDRDTRVVLDVGALGGVSGAVHAHVEGKGFATHAGLETVSVGGVLVDGSAAARKKKKAKSAEEAGGVLASWGFEEGPAEPGRSTCRRLSPTDFKTEIRGLSAKELALFGVDPEGIPSEADVPFEAWICGADGDRDVLVYADVLCETWARAVVREGGRLLSRVPGKDDAPGVDVRVTAGRRILIEVERDGGDAADVYEILPDGKARKAFPNASFRPGDPRVCRCWEP